MPAYSAFSFNGDIPQMRFLFDAPETYYIDIGQNIFAGDGMILFGASSLSINRSVSVAVLGRFRVKIKNRSFTITVAGGAFNNLTVTFLIEIRIDLQPAEVCVFGFGGDAEITDDALHGVMNFHLESEVGYEIAAILPRPRKQMHHCPQRHYDQWQSDCEFKKNKSAFVRPFQHKSNFICRHKKSQSSDLLRRLIKNFSSCYNTAFDYS